jgi:hypothetical protein
MVVVPPVAQLFSHFSRITINMSGLNNLNLIKQIAQEAKGKLGEQVSGMPPLSSFFYSLLTASLSSDLVALTVDGLTLFLKKLKTEKKRAVEEM